MDEAVVVTVQDEQRTCWCCLGTGENDRGSECVACDGSGVKPDSPPCLPFCRQPDREIPGVEIRESS